jgi:hypothetical protein
MTLYCTVRTTRTTKGRPWKSQWNSYPPGSEAGATTSTRSVRVVTTGVAVATSSTPAPSSPSLLSTAGTAAATAAAVPKSLYLADPFIIVFFSQEEGVRVFAATESRTRILERSVKQKNAQCDVKCSLISTKRNLYTTRNNVCRASRTRCGIRTDEFHKRGICSSNSTTVEFNSTIVELAAERKVHSYSQFFGDGSTTRRQLLR